MKPEELFPQAFRAGRIEYNARLDSIEIVDESDEAVTYIPRNMVIKMLSLLPQAPPAEFDRDAWKALYGNE